jgi:hypothetical protein
MINIKTFEEHLKEYINSKRVDILMESLNSINIINVKLTQNIFGLTTLDTIYVDVDKTFREYGEDGLLFIILHELAHYNRIKVLGKDWFLNFVLKTKLNDYIEYNIYEEFLADRFAKDKLSKLFNIDYASELTCRDYNTYLFHDILKITFTEIRETIKTEEEFNNYLKSFVLDVRN